MLMPSVGCHCLIHLQRYHTYRGTTPTEIRTTPPDTVFLLDQMNSTPYTAALIRRWTLTDPFIKSQSSCNERLEIFIIWRVTQKKSELSVESGYILHGHRARQGQAAVLDLLHKAHPGTDRIKRLAREYVWWPELDKQIEEKVKSCNACQTNRNTPELAPLHPWEWPWSCTSAEMNSKFYYSNSWYQNDQIFD